MPERPHIWVHAFLRAGILLGFSILIAALAKTDALPLYLEPYMIALVELAGVGLFIVGLFQLRISYRQFHQPAAIDCDCGDESHDHDHTPSQSPFRHAFIYGLFLIPLAFGLLHL
ncbi:DUF1980 domain-containing protein [Paenibacillus koleovorans]|uniref:DUF1980 domain-containing protein n=1 Tax=Paenibacillus koleovorans TaxID=121608 RepID=UPI000FD8040A|nr:DUF1980 domain-containing protein [Paenibacillus koleovorans]